jgi:hypothetical protein
MKTIFIVKTNKKAIVKAFNATKFLKLSMGKLLVLRRREQAYKAAKEQYVSECHYLADLITHCKEENDHPYILRFHPDQCGVSLIDFRNRVYARGFTEVENLLLKTLN